MTAAAPASVMLFAAIIVDEIKLVVIVVRLKRRGAED
jgi:hypothetical protein